MNMRLTSAVAAGSFASLNFIKTYYTMNMNIRNLGFCGMAASPFLAADFILGYINPDHFATPVSGILGFLYMTGWMCSIIALYKLEAAGDGFLGKLVLILQLCFLSLGQLWNLYHILDPVANSALFHFLDVFWPGSNLFMLVTGITVIKAAKLEGWKRYTPFIVGLWLPLSYLAMQIASKPVALYFSAAYSIACWFLMGLAVARSARSFLFKGKV
jgi:hypothetical protein